MAESVHVPNLANCRFYLQVFLTYLFSHAGLFGLIIGYAFVGASLFESIEAPNELSTRVYFEAREDFLRDIWDITRNLTSLPEKNWTTLVDFRVKIYEYELLNSLKYGDYTNDVTEIRWSFSGSFLYCITIIFTIGKFSVILSLL